MRVYLLEQKLVSLLSSHLSIDIYCLPCVYAAESISLAVLEMLVHTESEALLAHYALIAVEFDSSLMATLDMRALPDDWADSLAGAQTQAAERLAQRNRHYMSLSFL